MNTRNSAGTVQALIPADLVYARVGGTSLRLDLYTPSEAPSGTTPNLRDRPARATASTPAHRRT